MKQFAAVVRVVVQSTITNALSIRITAKWATELVLYADELQIGALIVPRELAESPVLHEEISQLLKPLGFVTAELNVWERDPSLPF
jgi:hypothetical protein